MTHRLQGFNWIAGFLTAALLTAHTSAATQADESCQFTRDGLSLSRLGNLALVLLPSKTVTVTRDAYPAPPATHGPAAAELSSLFDRLILQHLYLNIPDVTMSGPVTVVRMHGPDKACDFDRVLDLFGLDDDPDAGMAPVQTPLVIVQAYLRRVQDLASSWSDRDSVDVYFRIRFGGSGQTPALAESIDGRGYYGKLGTRGFVSSNAYTWMFNLTNTEQAHLGALRGFPRLRPLCVEPRDDPSCSGVPAEPTDFTAVPGPDHWIWLELNGGQSGWARGTRSWRSGGGFATQVFRSFTFVRAIIAFKNAQFRGPSVEALNDAAAALNEYHMTLFINSPAYPVARELQGAMGLLGVESRQHPDRRAAELSQAAQALTDVSNRMPGNSDVRNLLAMTRLAADRAARVYGRFKYSYGDAFRDFRLAVELDHDNQEARGNLFQAYRVAKPELSDDDDLFELCPECRACDPRHAADSAARMPHSR